MTAEDFDRYLRLELCWLDGVPTSASNALQRQCPHCRRKWSFQSLKRRWMLAGEFARGSNRRAAAAAVGVDVHTAGKIYGEILNALTKHFVTLLRRPEQGLPVDPERIATAYSRIRRTPDRTQRLRIFIQLGLSEMSFEHQLELIFRLVFRESVQRRTRPALTATFGRRLDYQPRGECGPQGEPIERTS